MQKYSRATLALALTLIGAGVACAPPPPETTDKAPAFPKRPGQEAPARAGVGGGGPTNHDPEGPAAGGGPSYRRHWNEDSKVWAWRSHTLPLYYRETKGPNAGQIHAYHVGEDPAKDKAFRSIARKLGLVQMGRAERRALHRAERKRYAAIVKARKEMV